MPIVTDKQKRALILEYEEILTNKRRQFSSYYFTGNAHRDSDIVVELFRYFFVSILCWDTETVEQRLSLDFLKEYKLDKFLRYIIFENEPNKKVRYSKGNIAFPDIQELIRLVYGNKYKIDLRMLVTDVYEDILSGNLQKFPKNFFSAATEGRTKACICLQYAINKLHTFCNVEELYRVFSDRNILKLLDEWHLKDTAQLLYSSPIEYLHDALPDVDKDETFYTYYKKEYENMLEETGRIF